MLSRMPDLPDDAVLHDNREDRFQLENLAGSAPSLVAQLRENELIPWLQATGDPWLQNIGI
jgi:N-acetylglucosamine-6-sulfatase